MGVGQTSSFRIRLMIDKEATTTFAGFADQTASTHNPSMTIKNAALLALVGTALITALLVWTFIFNFLNVLRGLSPAVTLFSTFIYAFGCFTVAVFFFVFHRAQS